MYMNIAHHTKGMYRLGGRVPGRGLPGLRESGLIQGPQPFQCGFYVLADTEFVVEGVPDDAVPVDEVGHAGNAQPEPTGDIIEAGDFLVMVGDEGEGKGELCTEKLVAVRAVGADADQVCSVPPDGFVCVTEALRLAVSARGEVLQIEVEDDGSAGPPFGEAELLAVVAEGVEIGSYRPWFEHSDGPQRGAANSTPRRTRNPCH